MDIRPVKRPVYHYTPMFGWMNDPNGLVYWRGQYHLFYQHHPHGLKWGPMQWGHAVSQDLVQWDHLPVALHPDKHGCIFSGSAVIDRDNHAGFGPEAMLAYFTYHDKTVAAGPGRGKESQGLAFSTDQGKSWRKYRGNPILKTKQHPDFRDPKVFQYDDNRWNMVLSAGDRIKIYSSYNLLIWTFESDFFPEPSIAGGVWECPDLFSMQIEQQVKWVLLLSNTKRNAGFGSGNSYIIGDFDGKRFHASQAPELLDPGMDFYAAQTFSNAPEGKRILMAWMNNWAYAEEVPADRWRGQMTIPRELQLVHINGQYRLRQYPIAGLSRYFRSVMESGETPLPLEKKGDFAHSQIFADFAHDGSDLELRLSNGSGDHFSLRYREKTLIIGRVHSKSQDLPARFDEEVKSPGPIEKLKNMLVLTDSQSVEIWVNGGLYTISSQVFPSKSFDTLYLEASDRSRLHRLEIKQAAFNR